MPRFKTTFNGYAAKFSPFVENRIAVATAQNFGIIGNGRLHVLEVSLLMMMASLVPAHPTSCRVLLRNHHTHATPLLAAETLPFFCHSCPAPLARAVDASWAGGDGSV